MIHARAEECFKEGKRRLDAGDARQALSHFKAAVDIDQMESETGTGQARYLSYYGLCLALTQRRYSEALHYCRMATSREGYRSVTWWNLGRVHLAFGKRKAAYDAWVQGLCVQPGHRGIRQDLERMGTRRPPVLSFVSRAHPLNMLLGRLRARLSPQQSSPTVARRRAPRGPRVAVIESMH
jgi:Tfp pilus assembly protein PilF